MTTPLWILFFFAVFPAVCVLVTMLLTAWIIFRIKFAGTGYRMVQPKASKSTGSKSYVSKLFEDLGENITEESPVVKRIKEQKFQPTGLKEVIKEVEGLI